MRRIPTLLVLFLAIVPVSAATDPGAPAPRAVVAAQVSDLLTAIAWAPGDEIADAYRVYGLATDAPPALLGTFAPADAAQDAFDLVVPTGFDGYAVSGVQAGVESPMVAATAVIVDDACIAVGPVYVIIRCMPVILR